MTNQTGAWSLGVVGAVMLLGVGPMAALTPTPTPTPPLVVGADPDPARSGQTVTLSASRAAGGAEPRWAQIDGPPVALAGADMLDASFTAPPVTARTTLQFRFSLPPYPDTVDLTVTVVPADAVDVVIDDDVQGPSGGQAEVGVTINPLGLSLASVRHRLAFAAEAPVSDRGNGTPDCDPAPGLATGSFAFLPDGCASNGSCVAVRADLAFATPLATPAIAYRCRLILTDQPTDNCTHALTCGGGDATSSAGDPLQLACSDGAVTAHFADNEAQIAADVEPDYVQVGTPVTLTFTVALPGGLPQYQLWGVSPYFDDTAVEPDLGTPGQVSYSLRPVRAGNALLQLFVNFETTGGCPGNEYFYFTYATSPTVPLTIHDPGGARLSGRVAEFPGCQGAMRGVDVVLQPGDRVTRTDLVDGSFAFDGVSPGDYALTVSRGCNPFGCWPDRAIHVAVDDLALILCPLTAACVGDCNGDRRVTIDELVRGVDLALGGAGAPTCTALDSNGSGDVQIEELVTAVNAALEGCSGVNNTTPTPTPTPPAP
ncbi:MAG TPA: hypothetical protein VL049_22385 [Candidatus Dormibacteraeota bacterium]|nr:hypothetical protein [Candidatus Dormibacteraeota bacterium]